MQIVNKNGIRILYPEQGYILINKKTGDFYEQVYLSRLDSEENYIERKSQEKSADMDFLMETIDGLFLLLEPIISSMPVALNENGNTPMDKIIIFYVEMIKKKLKTIDDIPSTLKNRVQDIINN